MAYDWGTQWPGVLARHAESCPFADGEDCTCGPLGYTATLTDPDTAAPLVSPLLETGEEARAWRREQQAAIATGLHATTNGNGNGRRGTRHTPEPARPRAAIAARESLRPASPAADPRWFEGPAPEPRSRRLPEPPRRERDPPNAVMSITELSEEFLDAAEDGQARGSDGRPYTDDELGELSWALTGYVEYHLGDLEVAEVRGRQVFRLVDELEDAGMPRSRLRSVLEAMRELFDYAADRGLVRTNPARYISLPVDERARRRLPETIESRRTQGMPSAAPFSDSVISEQTIWFIVKLVALVFILIALVLAAESI
jgi:hypothetical protein